jgi:uncharacterized protein
VLKVALAQIADGGTLTVKDQRLAPSELGLAAPFTAEPASVSYELNYTFGKVYAKLKAQAQVHLDCSRCLKGFDQVVSSDFLVQFEEKPERATLHGADPDDPEENVAFFVDEEMLLGEELRQELELQVPYRPLCKTDCAGLCPRCGADLNNGPCGCDLTPQNSPFAKLKGLIKEEPQA